MFQFIKAVFDSVLGMITYKFRWSWQAFDFYRGYGSVEARLPSSGSKFKLPNTLKFIKAVSYTVLDMVNSVHYDKPLIFIGTTFQEKLISHHQAVNLTCRKCWSLSRLFLTLYLNDKCLYRLSWQAFEVYRGRVLGEARLPSLGSEWRLFLTLYLTW